MKDRFPEKIIYLKRTIKIIKFWTKRNINNKKKFIVSKTYIETNSVPGNVLNGLQNQDTWYPESHFVINMLAFFLR